MPGPTLKKPTKRLLVFCDGTWVSKEPYFGLTDSQLTLRSVVAKPGWPARLQATSEC